MVDQFKDQQTKSQMRILKEKMDRERELFLNKEDQLLQSENNPLSQAFQLDSYEAVQKKLERRDVEDEYLIDERDAVDGEVTDSDQEFEAIVDVDKLIGELT